LSGVEPWHLVADVCAAPGSKTTQILDLMHAKHTHNHTHNHTQQQGEGGDDEDQPGSKGGGATITFPSGLVVANEFDAKRCRLFLAGRVRKVTRVKMALAASLVHPALKTSYMHSCSRSRDA
jgi:16S rRNA C967 or C1407 C5-methylase (RsmB/RsmF family)